MQWFKNLKIAAKLLIGFIIVAIIAAFVGIIGIVNINNINEADTELYQLDTLGIQYVSVASHDFQRLRYNTLMITVVDDPTTREETIKTVNNLLLSIEEALNNYNKYCITDEADQAASDLVISQWGQYRAYIQQYQDLINANKFDDARKIIIVDSDSTGDDLRETLKSITTQKTTDAKNTSESNNNNARQAVLLMIIVIAAGAVSAIILGIIISRIISKPINKMVDAMDRIANGDVEVSIDIDTKEEIGDLASSCRKTTDSIRLLIQEANKLTNAAVEGQLSVRGDVAQLKGGYRDIVNGVNNTLDAINKPFIESETVLGKIALNDYTLQMTGQYKGYFEKFAKIINDVRTRLLSVQDAFERVGKGDASRLAEFEKAGKRSENDRLIPACISALKSINGIIAETGKIADAAANGNLSVRGDKDAFEGGYKDIIAGFNRTLDTIAEPVSELSGVMARLANNDLTLGMQGEYKGEFAKMKDAVNSTIDSLNVVMTEIKSASEQVASGAKQVSDSSMALSQGATEQASSIEELTASLEEISSQTKLNADNAGKANELAENARSNAIKGNDQMKDMLKAMDEINISSSNINKIIKVIDDIAFQTNILALNAAVEAARAGQHGKGFAVVAEEVRTLAARSANAAKETTDLIEGSINKVEAGTKIAKETADALGKIVYEVDKAADLVNSISTASTEQAAGIEQINQGIMQISEVVQTNSATSQESAAASEELSSQAETLKDIVGTVKLKKVNRSYGELDEISPEVLKMLESMSGKRVNNHDSFNSTKFAGKKNSEQVRDKKIALSDKEFGKY